MLPHKSCRSCIVGIPFIIQLVTTISHYLLTHSSTSFWVMVKQPHRVSIATTTNDFISIYNSSYFFEFMPSTFGTLYSRCSICHIKPATLQCTPCDALLCFQCDQSQHQQIKHQRKLIQYEDHNKENHYHQNKEDSYSSFNLQENTDHMDLKYRIKLQE